MAPRNPAHDVLFEPVPRRAEDAAEPLLSRCHTPRLRKSPAEIAGTFSSHESRRRLGLPSVSRSPRSDPESGPEPGADAGATVGRRGRRESVSRLPGGARARGPRRSRALAFGCPCRSLPEPAAAGRAEPASFRRLPAHLSPRADHRRDPASAGAVRGGGRSVPASGFDIVYVYGLTVTAVAVSVPPSTTTVWTVTAAPSPPGAFWLEER